MTDMLTANPGVAHWILWSCNDDGVLGSIRALEAAGIAADDAIGVGLGAHLACDEWAKETPTSFDAAVFLNAANHGKVALQLMYDNLSYGTPIPGRAIIPGPHGDRGVPRPARLRVAADDCGPAIRAIAGRHLDGERADWWSQRPRRAPETRSGGAAAARASGHFQGVRQRARRSTTSRSTCVAARSSRSSARTAPASRRSCASSAATTSRTPGRSSVDGRPAPFADPAGRPRARHPGHLPGARDRRDRERCGEPVHGRAADAPRPVRRPAPTRRATCARCSTVRASGDEIDPRSLGPTGSARRSASWSRS